VKGLSENDAQNVMEQEDSPEEKYGNAACFESATLDEKVFRARSKDTELGK
jgi:hypothetical protein